MALRTMRVIFTGPAAMRSRRLAIPSIRASSRRAMLIFFLKHRNEPRGIGGIFYDDFSELGFESGCAMMQNVGAAFLDAYLPIIEARRHRPFGARERAFQAYRRGRYVEFNLLFDRGTLFGL